MGNSVGRPTGLPGNYHDFYHLLQFKLKEKVLDIDACLPVTLQRAENFERDDGFTDCLLVWRSTQHKAALPTPSASTVETRSHPDATLSSPFVLTPSVSGASHANASDPAPLALNSPPPQTRRITSIGSNANPASTPTNANNASWSLQMVNDLCSPNVWVDSQAYLVLHIHCSTRPSQSTHKIASPTNSSSHGYLHPSPLPVSELEVGGSSENIKSSVTEAIYLNQCLNALGLSVVPDNMRSVLTHTATARVVSGDGDERDADVSICVYALAGRQCPTSVNNIVTVEAVKLYQFLSKIMEKSAVPPRIDVLGEFFVELTMDSCAAALRANAQQAAMTAGSSKPYFQPQSPAQRRPSLAHTPPLHSLVSPSPAIRPRRASLLSPDTDRTERPRRGSILMMCDERGERAVGERPRRTSLLHEDVDNEHGLCEAGLIANSNSSQRMAERPVSLSGNTSFAAMPCSATGPGSARGNDATTSTFATNTNTNNTHITNVNNTATTNTTIAGFSPEVELPRKQARHASYDLSPRPHGASGHSGIACAGAQGLVMMGSQGGSMGHTGSVSSSTAPTPSSNSVGPFMISLPLSSPASQTPSLAPTPTPIPVPVSSSVPSVPSSSRRLSVGGTSQATPTPFSQHPLNLATPSNVNTQNTQNGYTTHNVFSAHGAQNATGFDSARRNAGSAPASTSASASASSSSSSSASMASVSADARVPPTALAVTPIALSSLPQPGSTTPSFAQYTARGMAEGYLSPRLRMMRNTTLVAYSNKLEQLCCSASTGSLSARHGGRARRTHSSSGDIGESIGALSACTNANSNSNCNTLGSGNANNTGSGSGSSNLVTSHAFPFITGPTASTPREHTNNSTNSTSNINSTTSVPVSSSQCFASSEGSQRLALPTPNACTTLPLASPVQLSFTHVSSRGLEEVTTRDSSEPVDVYVTPQKRHSVYAHMPGGYLPNNASIGTPAPQLCTPALFCLDAYADTEVYPQLFLHPFVLSSPLLSNLLYSASLKHARELSRVAEWERTHAHAHSYEEEKRESGDVDVAVDVEVEVGMDATARDQRPHARSRRVHALALPGQSNSNPISTFYGHSNSNPVQNNATNTSNVYSRPSRSPRPTTAVEKGANSYSCSEHSIPNALALLYQYNCLDYARYVTWARTLFSVDSECMSSGGSNVFSILPTYLTFSRGNVASITTITTEPAPNTTTTKPREGDGMPSSLGSIVSSPKTGTKTLALPSLSAEPIQFTSPGLSRGKSAFRPCLSTKHEMDSVEPDADGSERGTNGSAVGVLTLDAGVTTRMSAFSISALTLPTSETSPDAAQSAQHLNHSNSSGLGLDIHSQQLSPPTHDAHLSGNHVGKASTSTAYARGPTDQTSSAAAPVENVSTMSLSLSCRDMGAEPKVALPSLALPRESMMLVTGSPSGDESDDEHDEHASPYLSTPGSAHDDVAGTAGAGVDIGVGAANDNGACEGEMVTETMKDDFLAPLRPISRSLCLASSSRMPIPPSLGISVSMHTRTRARGDSDGDVHNTSNCSGISLVNNPPGLGISVDMAVDPLSEDEMSAPSLSQSHLSAPANTGLTIAMGGMGGASRGGGLSLGVLPDTSDDEEEEQRDSTNSPKLRFPAFHGKLPLLGTGNDTRYTGPSILPPPSVRSSSLVIGHSDSEEEEEDDEFLEDDDVDAIVDVSGSGVPTISTFRGGRFSISPDQSEEDDSRPPRTPSHSHSALSGMVSTRNSNRRGGFFRADSPSKKSTCPSITRSTRSTRSRTNSSSANDTTERRPGFGGDLSDGFACFSDNSTKLQLASVMAFKARALKLIQEMQGGNLDEESRSAFESYEGYLNPNASEDTGCVVNERVKALSAYMASTDGDGNNISLVSDLKAIYQRRVIFKKRYGFFPSGSYCSGSVSCSVGSADSAADGGSRHMYLSVGSIVAEHGMDKNSNGTANANGTSITGTGTGTGTGVGVGNNDATSTPMLSLPLLGLGPLRVPPELNLYKEEKLRFYTSRITPLTSFLFVSSEAAASSFELLRLHGITHIVNCAGDISPNAHPSQFKYLKMHLLDSAAEDITSVLYDIFDFVFTAITQSPQHKVLIHCQQGISRSTVACIATLMTLLHCSYDHAYILVRLRRGICRPNLGFQCQLMAWYKRLAATHAVTHAATSTAPSVPMVTNTTENTCPSTSISAPTSISVSTAGCASSASASNSSPATPTNGRPSSLSPTSLSTPHTPSNTPPAQPTPTAATAASASSSSASPSPRLLSWRSQPALYSIGPHSTRDQHRYVCSLLESTLRSTALFSTGVYVLCGPVRSIIAIGEDVLTAHYVREYMRFLHARVVAETACKPEHAPTDAFTEAVLREWSTHTAFQSFLDQYGNMHLRDILYDERVNSPYDIRDLRPHAQTLGMPAPSSRVHAQVRTQTSNHSYASRHPFDLRRALVAGLVHIRRMSMHEGASAHTSIIILRKHTTQSTLTAICTPPRWNDALSVPDPRNVPSAEASSAPHPSPPSSSTSSSPSPTPSPSALPLLSRYALPATISLSAPTHTIASSPLSFSPAQSPAASSLSSLAHAYTYTDELPRSSPTLTTHSHLSPFPLQWPSSPHHQGPSAAAAVAAIAADMLQKGISALSYSESAFTMSLAPPVSVEECVDATIPTPTPASAASSASASAFTSASATASTPASVAVSVSLDSYVSASVLTWANVMHSADAEVLFWTHCVSVGAGAGEGDEEAACSCEEVGVECCCHVRLPGEPAEAFAARFMALAERRGWYVAAPPIHTHVASGPMGLGIGAMSTARRPRHDEEEAGVSAYVQTSSLFAEAEVPASPGLLSSLFAHPLAPHILTLSVITVLPALAPVSPICVIAKALCCPAPAHATDLLALYTGAHTSPVLLVGPSLLQHCPPPTRVSVDPCHIAAPVAISVDDKDVDTNTTTVTAITETPVKQRSASFSVLLAPPAPPHPSSPTAFASALRCRVPLSLVATMQQAHRICPCLCASAPSLAQQRAFALSSMQSRPSATSLEASLACDTDMMSTLPPLTFTSTPDTNTSTALSTITTTATATTTSLHSNTLTSARVAAGMLSPHTTTISTPITCMCGCGGDEHCTRYLNLGTDAYSCRFAPTRDSYALNIFPCCHYLTPAQLRALMLERAPLATTSMNPSVIATTTANATTTAATAAMTAIGSSISVNGLIGYVPSYVERHLAPAAVKAFTATHAYTDTHIDALLSKQPATSAACHAYSHATTTATIPTSSTAAVSSSSPLAPATILRMYAEFARDHGAEVAGSESAASYSPTHTLADTVFTRQASGRARLDVHALELPPTHPQSLSHSHTHGHGHDQEQEGAGGDADADESGSYAPYPLRRIRTVDSAASQAEASSSTSASASFPSNSISRARARRLSQVDHGYNGSHACNDEYQEEESDMMDVDEEDHGDAMFAAMRPLSRHTDAGECGVVTSPVATTGTGTSNTEWSAVLHARAGFEALALCGDDDHTHAPGTRRTAAALQVYTGEEDVYRREQEWYRANYVLYRLPELWQPVSMFDGDDLVEDGAFVLCVWEEKDGDEEEEEEESEHCSESPRGPLYVRGGSVRVPVRVHVWVGDEYLEQGTITQDIDTVRSSLYGRMRGGGGDTSTSLPTTPGWEHDREQVSTCVMQLLCEALSVKREEVEEAGCVVVTETPFEESSRLWKYFVDG